MAMSTVSQSPREMSCIDLMDNHVSDLQQVRVILMGVLDEVRGPRPTEVGDDPNAKPTLMDNLLNADRLTRDIHGMAEELRERFTSAKMGNVKAGLGGQIVG